MAALSGTEILINTLLKMLGLNSQDMKSALVNIAQITVDSGDRLMRIERNQHTIARHLGIELEVENDQSPAEPFSRLIAGLGGNKPN
jgi:hypothetical protein